jgi:hypothetical protein
MMKSKDERAKRALDAMVSAYLVLKGPDGLPLIEDLFLKNKDAEYTETYATVQAIRFHGQEETVIPRERLAEALRYMLERPQLADIVIPDLARWQDWSVMDKLVELFKNADENTSFVRVPVVNYLRACPKKEAKEHLAELEKIDPDAVKRANTFFPFGAGAPAKPADSASPKPDAPPTKVEAGKPAAPPPDDKKTADVRKFNPEAGMAIGPAGLPQLAQAAREHRWEVGRGVVVAGLAIFSLALWGAFTLILRTGRTTRAN